MKSECDWNKLLNIPQDCHLEIELRNGTIFQFRKYEGVGLDGMLNFTRFEHKGITEYSAWDVLKWRTLVEEPKCFDWCGKNIQWVRDHLYTRKVISVMDCAGVLTVTAICYEEKDAPKPIVYLHSWRKLIEEYEWSEDNATWRKFE